MRKAVDKFKLVPDCATNGDILGIHSLVIDVTQRKIVEEQNARRRRLAERLVLLTANERNVYELLVRGKSNKEVAMELDIGLRSAVRRRQIIFEKLEVASMAELLQKLSNIQGCRTEA